MSMTNFVAATYAANGVLVMPAREVNSPAGPAKAPYVAGGFKAASKDAHQVAAWWTAMPSAAVGIPCRNNGIIALDADRHGTDDGVAAAYALFEANNFPPRSVPIVATPRDGRHFLFRRPTGLAETKGRLSIAIDVRDNAYVIAAGSVMADGRGYTLQNGSIEALAAAIGSQNLPEMPRWLTALVAKPPARLRPVLGPSSAPWRSPAAGPRQFSALIRTVVLAPDGRRNSTLYWASCRAGEMVADGAMPGEVAAEILATAGMRAGLPAQAAWATATGGIRAGMSGRGDHE